jgi:hypothetical protein
MHVAPQTADPIEIPVAITVDQMHSFRSGEDQRVIRVPQLMLRERMPNVLLVQLAKAGGGFRLVHCWMLYKKIRQKQQSTLYDEDLKQFARTARSRG